VLKKLMLATTGAALMATGFAASAEARTQIRIVGSSTVYPFTTAVAEQFARNNPRFRAPIVESTGTGGGIRLFCSGVGPDTPDAVNASRRMRKSELDMCASNGVDRVIEVKVGFDGLSVAAAKNSPFRALTLQQLYQAVAATLPNGSKNNFRTWNQIDKSLPNLPIRVMGPPPTSGTRDSFAELLVEVGCLRFPANAAVRKADAKKGEERCRKLREDGAFIEAGENDNLIVQRLVADPNLVGVFGYSFYEENRDKLKDIALDGIEADEDSITSFKYPGSRAMYIYIKGQHIGAIPGIREFLGEYSKPSTWGRDGYLEGRGLVPMNARQASEVVEIIRTLKPLGPGDLK
jgi:phosphate transport system substrate-binding protein